MEPWQDTFLEDLAKHGRLSRTAVRSGMPKQTVDHYLATDPIFAVAVADALYAYQDSVVLAVKKAAQ